MDTLSRVPVTDCVKVSTEPCSRCRGSGGEGPSVSWDSGSAHSRVPPRGSVHHSASLQREWPSSVNVSDDDDDEVKKSE